MQKKDHSVVGVVKDLLFCKVGGGLAIVVPIGIGKAPKYRFVSCTLKEGEGSFAYPTLRRTKILGGGESELFLTAFFKVGELG